MSWYNTPNELPGYVKRYLKDIETIFKVQNAKKEWVQYKMEPHQIEWHSEDVAILGSKAKHKIVTKSRNTSFTVSSIISVLMSIPFYPDQVIPIVRLNKDRANDLINDFKNIIKHMNVIKEIDGKLFPFDPIQVNMEAAGSIKFPNGVEIRAFPATNSASESIRGLRIAGCAGIIDESNFMKDFNNIYIALRDAAAGSIEGKKEFQILIGTTRKGRATPFNLWYEDILKSKPNNMKFYKWPVFNPEIVDLNKNLLEQKLDPIVKWHGIQDLEEKRNENLNTFKEEYMGMLVDGDDQFYDFNKIIASVNPELENYALPPHPGEFWMGIDVATGIGKDYFVISIFEHLGESYIQRHLNYTRDKDLVDMEQHCLNLIKLWKPTKIRIDSVGVGTQITQKLMKEYPYVEPIKGNMNVKGLAKKQDIGLNEYLHTNQNALINYKLIELLSDEIQINHYAAWNSNFKAESGVMGHGDITMANGYALLPDKWKYGKRITNIENTNLFKPKVNEKKAKEIKKDFEENILSRVEWYKKQAKMQKRTRG